MEEPWTRDGKEGGGVRVENRSERRENRKKKREKRRKKAAERVKSPRVVRSKHHRAIWSEEGNAGFLPLEPVSAGVEKYGRD